MISRDGRIKEIKLSKGIANKFSLNGLKRIIKTTWEYLVMMKFGTYSIYNDEWDGLRTFELK